MTSFHANTLALLPKRERPEPRSVDDVLAWAAENGLTLPASYLEWARYDRGALLEKYSNDDQFSFGRPTTMKTDTGHQALVIHRENQGNFDAVVPLGQGDDPPVLFAWCGRPPWVIAGKSLSDYLFAQVFDWQHQLLFSKNDPEFKEIAPSSHIEFGSAGIEAFLEQDFEALVSTSFVVDELVYQVRRFRSKTDERVIVTTPKDGHPSALITGDRERVQVLEEVIREAMIDRIVPPTFGSPNAAAHFIGKHLDHGQLRLLALSCLRPPSEKELAQLAEVHRTRSLNERLAGTHFPKDTEKFAFGDRALGFRIRFARVRPGRWVIDTVERLGLFGGLFSGR